MISTGRLYQIRECQDIFSKPTPTEEFLNDWLVRTCETIDRISSSHFYFDWWIQSHRRKPYLKNCGGLLLQQSR